MTQAKGFHMRLDTARAITDAAIAAATDADAPMAIAVVDVAGDVVLAVRMDGATPIATETVVAKARTALAFDRPTTDVVEAAERRPTVYDSFLTASSRPLVYSMGGIPLRDGGRTVGAVGASGGTGEQDVVVASAAVAAFERILAAES